MFHRPLSPLFSPPPTKDSFKVEVWLKAKVIYGQDPSIWREDVYGKWMRYSDYGDRSSAFGWEIDHIIPEAKGGQTVSSNLQGLNWLSNCKKSDNLPPSNLGAILASLLPPKK